MSKIQSILEYQELAVRTCTDLGHQSTNERHMNLGVITEIGETLDIFKKNMAYNKPMDLVNLGEELADIVWYIVNKCAFENLSLDENYQEVLDQTQELLETKMFTVPDLPAEIMSEAILVLILNAYCSPVDNIFSAPIVQIAFLNHIASWFDLDFGDCLSNNIDKLKVRYPEKFTEEAAIERNLEAERVELEKTPSKPKRKRK
jgi:NTP pyrophosphatase (non-canonical NTP hydrolase)